MRVRKSLIGAGAIAAGAVLAFALPAGASVNVQSESPGAPVAKIAKNAKLKANGAAVVVTVNVTCPSGLRAYLSTGVTQTVGETTTQGSGSSGEFVCTGATQKVKVANPAYPKPFQPGAAFAQAQLVVYSAQYSSVYTFREITNVA